jgi:ribosomal protein L40E
MEIFNLFKIYIPNRANQERHDVAKKQLTVVVLGILVTILMGLFPPWNYTIDIQSIHFERPADYAFILSPPVPPSSIDTQYSKIYGLHLDVIRLSIQWLLVIFITIVLILVIKIRSIEYFMTNTCYKCGGHTDNQANFCRECGQNLRRTESDQTK